MLCRYTKRAIFPPDHSPGLLSDHASTVLDCCIRQQFCLDKRQPVFEHKKHLLRAENGKVNSTHRISSVQIIVTPRERFPPETRGRLTAGRGIRK